jgi:RNA polymerase sigma factor (sigma-70 family)
MSNLDAEQYISSVSSPNLSLEEEKELFRTIKDENSSTFDRDEAIEKICRSHIRFVSQMADYYCKRCPVEMNDMIGVGVVGIMVAIEKFDISKNCKFTTYCGHWIKLEMIRHIQENCPVTIPSSVHDGLIKIQSITKNSDEELSREEIMEKLDIGENKMRKLEQAKIQSVSLQSCAQDDDESSFLDGLISDGKLDPSGEYERNDLLEYLHDLLEELDEKTYDIVMSGFLDKKVKLEDLGKKYNLSAERIRQIRKEATNKLRNKILERS